MRRTALASTAPIIAALLIGIAALSQKPPDAAQLAPGAMHLTMGKDIAIDVRSNPITYRGTTWHLVRLNKARFTLDNADHLTAQVTGALVTFDDVSYEVHAAVMDGAGRLLGTAHMPCPVQRIWVGNQLMVKVNLDLDFGVSRAYASARQFTVVLTDRKVLTPDQWQK